jgi:hypothetical protein
MTCQFPRGTRDGFTGRPVTSLTAKPVTVLAVDGEVELLKFGAKYLVAWKRVIWSAHSTEAEAAAEFAAVCRPLAA